MSEEVMIPKSYHDKVCENIIRFKDKQFYDAVHLLDDGTLEITVEDYTKVKRVLVEDDNHWGNLFYEDGADRPQGEWIPCSERLPDNDELMLVTYVDPRPEAMDIWIGWHEMENVWYIDGEAHSNELGNEVIAWMPLPKPWEGSDDEV